MEKQESKTNEYYGEETLKEIFTGLLEQKFSKEILEGRDDNEK